MLARRNLLKAVLLLAPTGGALALRTPPARGDHGEIALLTLSEAQWRERLSKREYAVLREEDTERPYTSPLNDEKRPGVYHCRGCDLPLFLSATKFDSGTGWPSFYDVIPGHIGTKRDLVLLWPRTEYHCKRCGGHQGHVFDDGPEPTGLRYCNNGLALRFRPDKA